MHNAITLDALRVISAIAHKGSFAQAAKSLYKVPSALTYTVSKLESDLGVLLFDRKGQRAVLTQAGKMLLKDGEVLLQATMRLEQGIRQVDSGWERHLVIAKDAVIRNQTIQQVVKRFCQLDLQVEISITEESLGGSWDALHSQRADIAVGVTGELPKGHYHLHEIGALSFAFVVSRDHPLCQHRGTVDTQMISRYPALVVADSSRELPSRSAGVFDSKQVIRLHNMDAKLAGLKQGLGVGFMPVHLIDDALESGELVALATSLHRPPIPIYFACSAHRQGRALNWFVEQFKQQGGFV